GSGGGSLPTRYTAFDRVCVGRSPAHASCYGCVDRVRDSRRNITNDTTKIHARNRNCGKNAIAASDRMPMTMPSQPAQFGQTPAHLNARDAAMIIAARPAAPEAWMTQPASSAAW